MTTELYIHCLAASLIGALLHVLVKIRSLAQDHKVANLEFSIKDYLNKDKWALIVDVLCSLILVYVIDEWLEMDSRIIGKIKSIFVFVGFTGSYVVLQLMSVAKKKFRDAVDYKTNEADKASGNLDKPTPAK